MLVNLPCHPLGIGIFAAKLICHVFHSLLLFGSETEAECGVSYYVAVVMMLLKPLFPALRQFVYILQNLFGGERLGWRFVFLFARIFLSGFFSLRLPFPVLLLLLLCSFFEVLHLLPGDGENFGIPVEVSLGVVSQSAASHHVLALLVAADTQQFVVHAHGFPDGEQVEFGGSEIASFRAHISEQDAESLARDGDVEDHGEGDVPGSLPECRDVFGRHVVIIEHQPAGFLPEVSQLLGASLELHAGCDAGQAVLDVLCRSLVHLHHRPVAFGIGFHRCRMHDVVLQHFSVGERFAGRGLQSLEKRGKDLFLLFCFRVISGLVCGFNLFHFFLGFMNLYLLIIFQVY